MEHKLCTHQYRSLNAFVDDVQLIFDNCRAFNPEGSSYARHATYMEKYFKDQLAERFKKEE
jgi:histone acetyltransferase